ncbi:MAG: AEC family transporter [Paracoccaceae bacterium]|nr:AEC family transporter [Paracoccaceae bacterium]
MIEVLIRVLPFFALIGVGYLSGRSRFLSEEGVAGITKFVFYFALSAMLFKFASNLSLGEIYSTPFVLAYLTACTTVYILAFVVAKLRRVSMAEAAVEAQCAVCGNTGFLGVPLLIALLGPKAAGPELMVLTIDMIVFSSVITLMITAAREGRVSLGVLKVLVVGLLKNPMIVSMALGLAWSATGAAVPRPVNDFMGILGGAATPGALFAIGASLAARSAERVEVAAWLSFCKLALHPAAVAVAALMIFPVERFAAHVMIAAASLPVAGNTYILAQHYGVAPQRVSASILISTAFSVLTVSGVIAWIVSA